MATLTSQNAALPGQSPSLIRWSAVAAGSIVALGLMVMLFALGLAFGLTGADFTTPGRWRWLGIFAGTWGALTPLLALFVGGWVASRSTASSDRGVGFLHGLTVWGVAVIGLVYLLTGLAEGVGAAASTTADQLQRAGSSLLSEGRQLSDNAAKLGQLAAQAPMSLDSLQELLTPLNKYLGAQGKPTLALEKLQNAASELSQRVAKEGNLDRAVVKQVLVTHTGLSNADVDTLAEQLEARLQQTKQGVQETYQQAKGQVESLTANGGEGLGELAEGAAGHVAKAFWGLFAALALGLGAATAGAQLAVRESTV